MDNIRGCTSGVEVGTDHSLFSIDSFDKAPLFRTYTDPNSMPVRTDRGRVSFDVSMSHGRTSPSKKPLPLEPRASTPPHIEHPSSSAPNENELRYDAPSHLTSTHLPPSIGRSIVGALRRPRQPRYDSKSDLEHLLDDADMQIKEKDEEIQLLKENNEELKKVWMDTAANLADTKATISYTLEDGIFIGEWKQLQYDIRNWSQTRFQRAPGGFTKWYKRDLSPSKHLLDLTPHWKSYLDSDILRPLLAEALVWSLLQKLVFAWPPSRSSQMGYQKPGGAYWAYDDQSSVATLNERMKPKVETIKNFARLERSDAMLIKEYFAWRVATVAWIQRHYGNLHNSNRRLHNPMTGVPANREIRNTNILDLVSKITSTLSPFTENVGSAEIGRIISLAVDLDSRMWLQKAFFHPSKPKWIHNGQNQLQRFHPDTMELHGNAQPNELNPNPEITLIVCPSLVKSGNSDGEEYGVFNTLVKAQVSCEPIESRQASPMSHGMHSNQGGFKNAHSLIASPTAANPPRPTTMSRKNSGAAREQQSQGWFDPNPQSAAFRQPSREIRRNKKSQLLAIENY